MQSDLSTPPAMPLQFTGTAKEYFGIWIVNILLTIITLGIYTPWAKVRNNRYFYGNTLLNGAGFDYLASPIAILKGWAIAAVLLAVYFGLSTIAPMVEIVFFVVFLFLLPWLVVKAMRFRLRNTAYRNIRFNFQGDYGRATAIYTGLMFAMPFTLGMIYPFFMHRQTQFIADNSQYGQSSFKFLARAGDFYAIFMMLSLLSLLVFMAIGGAVALLGPALSPELAANTADPSGPVPLTIWMFSAVLVPAIVLLYLLSYAYMQSQLGNLTWNNLQLDQHRFKSTLTTRGLMGLYLTNTLAIIVSFGLAIPWAKIRSARYRIENLSFIPQGDLENYLQGVARDTSAVGEQIGDAFDVDIGL